MSGKKFNLIVLGIIGAALITVGGGRYLHNRPSVSLPCSP